MAEKTELLEEDEKVVEIELERLRGFENHPFKVRADSQMIELQESIKKYGILNPLIVRPKKDGCYEIMYEAIKRKAGRRKCGQVDHNLGKKSIELIGEECGDSPKQVQLHRFFSVTYTAEQMRWEILEMLKLNMKKYWDA